MSIFKNKFVQLILFVSFGVILLYLVYLNQKNLHIANCVAQNGPDADCDYFEKIKSDLRQAKLVWVLASLVIFMISNIIRALRWNMLFKTLNYTVNVWNSFFSIMLGYMVNLGLPRAGEVAKIAALSRNENIPLEEVTGTLVVDRTMDFICLFLMMVIGISFEYNAIVGFIQTNASLPSWLLWIPIIPILGFVWFLRIRKTSKLKIIQKINALYEGFSAGIMSVFRMKNKGLFILYSVLIWFCYYLMTYVVFFSYEPTADLSPMAGLVVFVFGALGMVIPSPGGAGTYHYLISKGLELYGVTDGFVFANIIFIPIQVLCNIGFGLLAYIVLPMLNKDDPTDSQDSA